MIDACACFAWTVLTIAILRWCWNVGAKLFPADSVSARVVHAAMLFWSIVVAWATVLSLFGQLHPWLLMPAVLFTAFLLSALASHRISLLGNETSGAPVEADQRIVEESRCTDWRHLRYVWGGMLIFVFSLVATVSLSQLFDFPRDFDTLAYHLPLVDHWINERSLYVPECAYWYVPGNSELLAYWIAAPFSGDFLTSLTNLCPYLILIASCMAICDELRLSSAITLLFVIAAALSPVVVRQVVTLENDMSSVATFSAAILYSVRYLNSDRRRDLIFFSIAIGLMFGVKYVSAQYAFALGFAMLLALAISGRLGSIVRMLIAGCISSVSLGGYWYLRNLFYTGTPLFPMNVFGGGGVWSEMRKESGSLVQVMMRGTGDQWIVLEAVWQLPLNAGCWSAAAAMLMPLLLISLICSAGRCGVQSDRLIRKWLSGVLALAALVFLMTPNVVEIRPETGNMLGYHSTRLGLCFVFASSLSLAVVVNDLMHWSLVQRLRGKYQRFYYSIPACLLFVAAGAVLLQAFSVFTWRIWHAQDLWLFLNTLIVAVTIVLFSRSRFPIVNFGAWGLRTRLATLFAATLLLSVFSGYLSFRWHEQYNGYYVEAEISRELEIWWEMSSTDSTNTEKLCFCGAKYYPAFGSRRQHDVCRPLYAPKLEDVVAFARQNRATLILLRKKSPVKQQDSRYFYQNGFPSLSVPYLQHIHGGQKYSLYRFQEAAESDRCRP